MEIFVFWKTMNNQTSRYLLCFASAVALTLGPVTQARNSGSDASPSAENHASGGSDRISVTLIDPARPALVKASLVHGGITLNASVGEEIAAEADSRGAREGE